MANWKVWKFRELDEIAVFLNGGVHGTDVSYFGNSMGGSGGGSKGVPNLVGTTLTLKNPPGSVTFVTGANPQGLLYADIKSQIEGAIAGVLVKQFEGRIYLIESTPSTGVVVAAAPAGGFARVNGTVDLNTLTYGGGGSLDGTALVLKHNEGGDLTVNFVAPANRAAVIAQINAVTLTDITASINGDNTLHLQTPDEGTGKSLRVAAGGSSLTVLGLTAGKRDAPSTNTANAALGFDTVADSSGKVYGSPPAVPFFDGAYSDPSAMHVLYTFE